MRTLVTPYCKRIHPPGRRTTRRSQFPLTVLPLCVLSRADPSGLGHTATIYSSVQGPPGVETPIARFQADPKEVHLRDVKRIMRYLVYTPKFALWYPKESTFDLIGYSNADWAGCKIDRKSTSGTCQFLGRPLVSWASKKQNSVALSTSEVEYIAAGHCCAQLLWMRQTLRDYGYKFSKVPLL
jgi:hypothetical protein